jgi:hypothetical protein
MVSASVSIVQGAALSSRSSVIAKSSVTPVMFDGENGSGFGVAVSFAFAFASGTGELSAVVSGASVPPPSGPPSWTQSMLAHVSPALHVPFG